MFNNEEIKVKDVVISDKQYESRKSRNEKLNGRMKEGQTEKFEKSDLVFIKNSLTKHTAREVYIIVDIIGDRIEIMKFKNQIRNKTYPMLKCELMKIPMARLYRVYLLHLLSSGNSVPGREQCSGNR